MQRGLASCARSTTKRLFGTAGRGRLPGGDCQTDDEKLLGDPKKWPARYNHLVGSCRMGSDANAVVAPDWRVNGVDELRVVEPSIMPRSQPQTTNAAT